MATLNQSSGFSAFGDMYSPGISGKNLSLPNESRVSINVTFKFFMHLAENEYTSNVYVQL